MADPVEIKRLERRAKSYMLSKDVPQEKMKVLKNILNNQALEPYERYTTIINLLHSCPDKITPLYQEKADERVKHRTSARRRKPIDNKNDIETLGALSGPTATSLYVNDILSKYRSLKLFKKRYLVHRNNRFGIGLRKRIIPSKHFIKIMEFIAEQQEFILSRLNPVLMDILQDEQIQDPTHFNYLRMFRRWMMDQPFSSISYDSVKWMEQQHFERELKNYLREYYSLRRIQIEVREQLILLVESRLRELDDLRKDKMEESDSDSVKREKDKNNLAKEKQIFTYMLMFRSFLESDVREGNNLDDQLKKKYNISGFEELLIMAMTALVYQRFYKPEELIIYYRINTPIPSSTIWDYSEDYLRKVGKDSESRRERSIENLRKRLAYYETLYKLAQADDSTRERVIKAAEIQWKQVDRRRLDSEEVYRDNYFNFLDAIIQYFKNTYIPILDGRIIQFKCNNTVSEGSLFTSGCFEREIEQLNSIIGEMHFFRSNNPTLAVSRNEIKNVMTGKITSMNDVRSFIVTVGDYFYHFAVKLQLIFDDHKRWLDTDSAEKVNSENKPIDPEDEIVLDDRIATPFPYNECVISGFENSGSLSKLLLGKRVIDENPYDGIIPDCISFCYHVALDCMNEKISADFSERKRLLNEIREASR